MSELLECVELGPEQAKWSVIWLHGLGADGHDFEPLVPELRLPDDIAVRFVFPHAPVRPVTLNGGMPMRAWFDLAALHVDAAFDRDGFEQARAAVLRLIERENARGVPTEKIILAGFSMGGAVALATGVMLEHSLAGIIGLSTFLFPPEKTGLQPATANRNTPVFMAHGEYDPVVPLAFGEATRDQLIALGHSIDWHVYGMPHAVCAEEIVALREWLRRVSGNRSQELGTRS